MATIGTVGDPLNAPSIIDAMTDHESRIDALETDIEGVWIRWTGTQAEYDALGTYDPNTLYVVTS